MLLCSCPWPEELRFCPYARNCCYWLRTWVSCVCIEWQMGAIDCVWWNFATDIHESAWRWSRRGVARSAPKMVYSVFVRFWISSRSGWSDVIVWSIITTCLVGGLFGCLLIVGFISGIFFHSSPPSSFSLSSSFYCNFPFFIILIIYIWGQGPTFISKKYVEIPSISFTFFFGVK